jgi:CRISPR-associated protein Cmr1
MFNSSHSLKVRNYEKLSHPTIASIWFGRPYTSAWDVVIAYAKASSKNQTGMLGQVSDKKRNKKRFASPLWGSVKEIGGKYYPVITELQSQSITNMKKYENERNEFLEVLGVSI